MGTLIIDLPPQTRERLEEQARKTGKTIEALTRELIENALGSPQENQPKTAREALQATGRLRPLSDTLRRKIIRDVTLDEVRISLTKAAGRSMSALILEQRGPKL